MEVACAADGELENADEDGVEDTAMPMLVVGVVPCRTKLEGRLVEGEVVEDVVGGGGLVDIIRELCRGEETVEMVELEKYLVLPQTLLLQSYC